MGYSVEAFGDIPVDYSSHVTSFHVDFFQSVDKRSARAEAIRRVTKIGFEYYVKDNL